MADTLLYAIPETLLAEYGLRFAGQKGRSYCCDAAGAVLLPVSKVLGPVIAPGRRGYTLDRLRPILAAVAAGTCLPPVPVYLAEPAIAVLLDGAHRLAVSIACGFPEIPCRPVMFDEAATAYGYPTGQL